MAWNTKVTLFKGGTREKTLPISHVCIPNLWHIAEAIRTNGKVADGPGCAKIILEAWHIAGALRRHIEES